MASKSFITRYGKAVARLVPAQETLDRTKVRWAAIKSAGCLEHQAGMFPHFMEADARPVFFGYADFGGK